MFGAVGDFTVHVGGVLMFGGQMVVVLLEDCLYVPYNGYSACLLLVVPLKVDTGGLISFPVSGDGVVLFQRGEEVFGVAFLYILNS